jgi:hypothetical protein
MIRVTVELPGKDNIVRYDIVNQGKSFLVPGTFVYRVERFGMLPPSLTGRKFFFHRREDGFERCIQLALGAFHESTEAPFDLPVRLQDHL